MTTEERLEQLEQRVKTLEKCVDMILLPASEPTPEPLMKLLYDEWKKQEASRQSEADHCTCHERDSSVVCEYCYAQGYRGHMQRAATNDCQDGESQEGLPPMDSTKPCPVCGTDKKLVWGYSASATKETLSYRCSMCGHRDYLRGYEP